MFLTLPPMNLSSISTMPEGCSLPVSFMASRMGWSMNQTDYWVIPSAGATSQRLTALRRLQIIQKAHTHSSSPSGESSKIVPALGENYYLHPLQVQVRRVFRNECLSFAQRGHVTNPSPGPSPFLRPTREMRRNRTGGYALAAIPLNQPVTALSTYACKEINAQNQATSLPHLQQAGESLR